jgi:hypothetical protein
MHLHRALSIVARDVLRFVKMTVQFGGAIRGANFKRVAVRISAATSDTV